MWQVLRSIYIWTAIASLTAVMYFVGLPLFILTWPFDRNRALGHWYAQRWGRWILRLNNRWSSEVRGQEKIPRGKPLVVIANHQGMGDIMMAFSVDIHFKWISKASNFYVPFMGWFMYHAGYIPLVRGKRESIQRCMDRAREYLDRGVSVLFFPEGTRSKDGHVQPFKPGAFKLALTGGYDILPLGITGTANALPKGTWRFSDEHAAMRVLVGDVISTRGLGEKDIDALMVRAREKVIALKDELDGQGYSAPMRAAG